MRSSRLWITTLLLALFATPAPAQPEYLLQWGSEGSDNGQFVDPRGVAVDAGGSVFVVDGYIGRVQKFTNDGTYVTQWTSPVPFYQFDDIATDDLGYVYVSDYYCIHKFTSSGGYVTTWGSLGSNAGQFGTAPQIASDPDGTIYALDPSLNRVQKFSTSGDLLMQWGATGGGPGQLVFPYGVASDGAGNVFVVDRNYIAGTRRVVQYTSGGAYVGQWGTMGSGPGQFMEPLSIAWDPGAGLALVCDYSLDRIQRYTATGAFVDQWGSTGSGDGEFDYPYDVAADDDGNVFVLDANLFRVQKFGNSAVGVDPIGPVAITQPVWLAPPFPNPSRGAVACAVETNDAETLQLSILDVRGRVVRSASIEATSPGRRLWTWDGLDDRGAPVAAGVYRVRVVGAGGEASRSLVRVD